MRLIVGGKGQGKLRLLLSEGKYVQEQVTDGADCPLEDLGSRPVLNHLHLLVRRWTASGKPLDELKKRVVQSGISVILWDEIGSGIVPIDKTGEQWREDTGRLCCDIAAQAEIVDRVFCGLCQRIKEIK